MGLGEADPRQSTYFSLSNDGTTFQPQQLLFHNISGQDKYIVAVGFVAKGSQLMGALYGAGPVESLDQNAIYGRWLQKKVVVGDVSGTGFVLQGGFGPDRQRLQVPAAGLIQTTIHIYAEDGVTPLASGPVSVNPGKVYQLVIQ